MNNQNVTLSGTTMDQEKLRQLGDALAIMEEDDLDEQYPLKKNHLDPKASWGGCLFETYGEELTFVGQQNPRTVWTLVDGDDGEYLLSGLHLVNRIGYLLSSVAVPEGLDIQVCLGNEGCDEPGRRDGVEVLGRHPG